MNVIADMSGHEKTLKALLVKMPKGEFLSVGDMIDRGPNSKAVLEFVKSQGRALLGNHEHFLIDAFNMSKDPKGKPFYMPGTWLQNGGYETLKSFRKSLPEVLDNEPFPRIAITDVHLMVPEELVNWLKTLPLIEYFENFVITHAPIHPKKKLEDKDLTDIGTGFVGSYGFKEDNSLIWNRIAPRPIDGKIQIFGHNNNKGVLYYTEEFKQGTYTPQPKDKIFAICIDQGRTKKLTGIHLPTLEIFTQEFID